MQVEIKTEQPYEVRITLDPRELYFLKVALERACYMDTSPEDQHEAHAVAETLLRAIQGSL